MVHLWECLRARCFLPTAPPPVLALAVLGALTVWIQIQKKIAIRAFFKAVKVVLLQASALRKDPLHQDTH